MYKPHSGAFVLDTERLFDPSLRVIAEAVDTHYADTIKALDTQLYLFRRFSPDGDKLPPYQDNPLSLTPFVTKLESVYLASSALRAAAVASGHPQIFPSSDAFEESIDLGFLNPEDMRDADMKLGRATLQAYAPLDEIVDHYLPFIDPTEEDHAIIRGTAGFAFGTIAMIMSLELEANQQQ